MPLAFETKVSNRALFFAMLVDVAILTAQLYLSGGTSNPFIFLYLLQVILGAVFAGSMVNLADRGDQWSLSARIIRNFLILYFCPQITMVACQSYISMA